MAHDPTSSRHDEVSHTGRNAALIILAVVIIACIVFVHHYAGRSTFLPESSIDGINVSGMTSEQAAEKLQKIWKNRKLELISDGKTVAAFSYKNYDYDNAEEEVQKALDPGTLPSLERAFSKSKRKMTVSVKPKIDEDAFDETFYNMSIVRDAKYTTKSKSAYVDLSNTKFEIRKEVYGDELDKTALKNAVMKAISEGKTKFYYKASDFYIQPEVKSTSPSLKKEQEFAKKYLTQKITYNGPVKDYTIQPKDLNKMLHVKNGSASVDEDAVHKFVSGKLSQKINTVGMQRKLKSVGGGTYIVAGGNYGYQISVKKETAKLVSDLKSGKNVTREPVYSQKGKAASKGNSDIGDSFVEVDIPKQTVYCVIKGKKVLTSSVVTGNVSEGHDTPYGVCYLAYKERNATLTGQNADGSDYESKVSYWMPFNGGVGLHDAPWRDSFGGSIYKSSGSHGCVNMPPANAKKLYHYVYAGIPVIVHA